MTRIIKFRGKACKNYCENFHKRKFVYGSIIYLDDCHESTIMNDEFEAQVDTDTVGQFIGLIDGNGKEVYEGDILQDPETIISKSDDWERAVVYYDEKLARFGLNFYSSAGPEGYTGLSEHIHQYIKSAKYTVVGNIHENTEMVDPI